MNSECRHLEAGELDSQTLAQIERILVASFPSSEREPFPVIVDDLRAGRAALYAAVDGPTVLGFGLTLPLTIRGWHYLSYLAVDRGRRGGGIGGRLFRSILEEAFGRTGSTAFVWEVERPDADMATAELKRRRIAFYERHGGVLLTQVRDYQMPDLAPTEPGRCPGTIPAQLMWASYVARPPLTRAEVLALVASVFRVGYGRDLTDPLVRYVLSTVEADGEGV